MQGDEPTIARLEDQIQWYQRKCRQDQRWFKILKILTIVLAAAIPVVTGSMGARFAGIIAGVLGALVSVVEGLQQLGQFHASWIAYRSTCESLLHEKYLYLAGAGPYGAAANRPALLAERVESLVSQENLKWASKQEKNPEAGQ